jgi:dihydrofolate reductase/thymidylate synthase
MTNLNIIFATSTNNVFSFKNKLGLPWTKIKSDLEHFKNITTGNGNNAIIMGRKTFESLPCTYLPNRLNIVITHDSELLNSKNELLNLVFTTSLQSAIDIAICKNFEDVFVIGGITLIQEALSRSELKKIYITKISEYLILTNLEDLQKIEYKLPANFIQESCRVENFNNCKVEYYCYSSHTKVSNNFEKHYLNLLKHVLENGKERTDRTNVGTISIFGNFFKLNVENEFPLLTTKKMFWKGIVEELLFFISGSSDTKILEQKGINIWRGNTSKEFLNKYNLTEYREGEMGPGYGYQWRHFGKKYIPLDQRDKVENEYQGVDQLQNAIDLIKNNPESRRIMVSSWNVIDLDKVCLPPCHYNYEFYVEDENKLSILVNMRSVDLFLGLPFNIASYTLLLYMIAHLCNLKPYEVSFSLGDSHIYLNHLEQVKLQLNREVKNAPKLKIVRNVRSIDDFKFEDFELINYECCGPIKADMAV